LAKRSITQDKADRVDSDREYMAQQARLRELETRYKVEQELRKERNNKPLRSDYTGDPSSEAATDPAPTRHAPATEGQKATEKSKYAASEVFRSPKGDRLG
jgi:hypothetical protein